MDNSKTRAPSVVITRSSRKANDLSLSLPPGREQGELTRSCLEGSHRTTNQTIDLNEPRIPRAQKVRTSVNVQPKAPVSRRRNVRQTSQGMERRSPNGHLVGVKTGCIIVAACLIIALTVGLGVGLSTHKRSGVKSIGTPFNDTFHTINATLWTVSNNRTNGGAYNCAFTNGSVDLTAGGGLNLEVYPKRLDGESYGCGQLVRNDSYRYGLFSVAMQAARGPGVVTAAFLYAETQPNINQEIDIEITGADTRKLWVTAYRDAQENTTAIPLPFDAAQSVHTYAFAWHSDSIRWYVDGDEVHRLNSAIPRPVPLQYMISTWLRKPNEWAGEYNLSEQINPTQSHFDWVSYAS